jgi:hypothetical protein
MLFTKVTRDTSWAFDEYLVFEPLHGRVVADHRVVRVDLAPAQGRLQQVVPRGHHRARAQPPLLHLPRVATLLLRVGSLRCPHVSV